MPMQLLVRLEATRECSWDRSYHRKLRGTFDAALEGTAADRHEDDVAGYTFSDPMPYQPTLEPGDELHLVVASPDVAALRAIARGLQTDPEVTAGAMVLEARAATPIAADVGPPGSAGTITTASGSLVIVEPRWERDGDTHEYWTDRRYDVATYRQALLSSIQSQCRRQGIDPPTDDPFDDYDHNKTYAVDVEVAPAEKLTVIASKWDYHYEVRDEAHREVLNQVLAGGVGARRAYGFGMCQTREDEWRANGEGVGTEAADA